MDVAIPAWLRILRGALFYQSILNLVDASPSWFSSKRFHRSVKMRTMILVLVLGTLLVTVGVIAVVGFQSSREALADLNREHYSLAITEVRNQTARTLESILLTAAELQAMLRGGLLPRNDMEKLGFFFAERLRHEGDVDEICYTALPSGAYVSANRTIPSEIIIRHAVPGIPADQTSEIILPSGQQVVFNDPYWKKPYDPRQRPWFLDILAGNGKLVWTHFRAIGRSFDCLGAGVLITDEDNNAGVFMADSSAERLEDRLAYLLPQHHRLLFVLTNQNWLLAQHSTIAGISPDRLRVAALGAVSEDKSLTSRELFEITSMTFEGTTFEVAFAEINLEGGLRCKIGLVIPEEQFLKLAKSNLHSTIFFGLCALAVTAILLVWVSQWLASPLSQLSTDLERVAAFDIPSTPSPSSCIRELAVVSDAVERLKTALRSFGRYVPVGVVRELIATHRDASRGGKEYFITILFSELEMIHSNESIPESLRILQEYFTIATKTVEMEGAIDKYFGGGGVMALFNEPHPVLYHADAACLAALRWRDEWQRTLQGMKASVHHEIRFGINTGTALVGNIGTKDRFAYTAMGDTVNLAHRLLELAFSLRLCILVGDEAYNQISRPFDWRFLGSHQVSGRTEHVAVWELLGEKDTVPPHLLQARDQFEQGLQEMSRGDQAKARFHFLRALEMRPSDRLTEIYLEELDTPQ